MVSLVGGPKCYVIAYKPIESSCLDIHNTVSDWTFVQKRSKSNNRYAGKLDRAY